MKTEAKKTREKAVIYQAKNGALELRGDTKAETLWATQAQIGNIFDIERSVITKHIRNIYKEGELQQKATCAKIAQVQVEGRRRVERNIEHYNLDMIISVGYRVNSKTATQFRQWATKTLKEHLTKGYTINKKIVLKNYDQFLVSVTDIQALLPVHVTLDPKVILDLVKEYSVTWAKLDAYDRDALIASGATKKKIKLSAEELLAAILELRAELIRKGEATDIFAHERSGGSIEGIVGNVMQAFGGSDVYKTLEEKAAHLLYFVVKNHPFTDGNKRSGAFAFIWFLRKYRVGGAENINPSGLTAITLLIAESDPKQKEKVVALVVELLRVNKK
ncbi:MAG: virulence protein RhuM/Fic/DOC family protein [Candidatus Moranbacteria bacterium]|nr:virulence protein RhuM/Fic/DOC family protein [Candidatus Moranbacteria bacterium]